MKLPAIGLVTLVAAAGALAGVAAGSEQTTCHSVRYVQHGTHRVWRHRIRRIHGHLRVVRVRVRVKFTRVRHREVCTTTTSITTTTSTGGVTTAGSTTTLGSTTPTGTTTTGTTTTGTATTTSTPPPQATVNWTSFMATGYMYSTAPPSSTITITTAGLARLTAAATGDQSADPHPAGTIVFGGSAQTASTSQCPAASTNGQCWLTFSSPGTYVLTTSWTSGDATYPDVAGPTETIDVTQG